MMSRTSKIQWQEPNRSSCVTKNVLRIGKKKERYSYEQLSALIQASTDKGAEKAYKKALENLLVQLIEDRAIRAVRIKQKNQKRRKQKIAAATYLYQADCDGEWGEIYIDFVNKTAKIIQLADWDLTRSRVYARTAIRFLISTGGRNLPKKRRVIFEPQRPPRRRHKRKLEIPNTDIAGYQEQQEIPAVSERLQDRPP